MLRRQKFFTLPLNHISSTRLITVLRCHSSNNKFVNQSVASSPRWSHEAFSNNNNNNNSDYTSHTNTNPFNHSHNQNNNNANSTSYKPRPAAGPAFVVLDEHSLPDVPIIKEARRTILAMYGALLGLILLSCGISCAVIEIMDASPKGTWLSFFFVESSVPFLLFSIGGLLTSALLLAMPHLSIFADEPLVRRYITLRVKVFAFISFFVFSGFFWAAAAAEQGKHHHGKLVAQERWIIYWHTVTYSAILLCAANAAISKKASELIIGNSLAYVLIFGIIAALVFAPDKDPYAPKRKPDPSSASRKHRRYEDESARVSFCFVTLLLLICFITGFSSRIAVSTFLRIKNTKHVVVVPTTNTSQSMNNNNNNSTTTKSGLGTFNQINIEKTAFNVVVAYANKPRMFDFLDEGMLSMRGQFAHPDRFSWTLPKTNNGENGGGGSDGDGSE